MENSISGRVRADNHDIKGLGQIGKHGFVNKNMEAQLGPGRGRRIDAVGTGLPFVSGQLRSRKGTGCKVERIWKALLSRNTNTMEESRMADGPSQLVTKGVEAANAICSSTAHHGMMTVTIQNCIRVGTDCTEKGAREKAALQEVNRPL